MQPICARDMPTPDDSRNQCAEMVSGLRDLSDREWAAWHCFVITARSCEERV